MSAAWEFQDNSGEAPVRGFLHMPAGQGGGALVLTHGAGASCNAPLLVALAEVFCASGLTVLRCDLPFRRSAVPAGASARASSEGQRRARPAGPSCCDRGDAA